MMLTTDIESFLAFWQTSRKCSPQTVRGYRNDLKLFVVFMNELGLNDISSFGHSELNMYIESMQTQANPRFGRVGLSDASIRRRLACLNSFIDYLRAGTMPDLHNPLRNIKRKWTKNNRPKPPEEGVLTGLLDGI